MTTTCSSTKRKRDSPEKLCDTLDDTSPSTAEVQKDRPKSKPNTTEESSTTSMRRKKQRTRNPVALPIPIPPHTRYIPLVFGGSYWHGRDSLQNVVVLGDSYSNSKFCKTWVDFLEEGLQIRESRIDIRNFALPGATAEDDLADQLSRFFVQFPPKGSPDASPTLQSEKTTYCESIVFPSDNHGANLTCQSFFFGINDCGMTDSDDLEPIVEIMFDAVHDLYVKAGARNFVFVDVPPVDRSPQVMCAEASDTIGERINMWNELLQAQIVELSTSSTGATVFLFSSCQVMTEVLDDPLDFDFTEDDATNEGSGIWQDDLHPTEGLHDILSQKLIDALFSPSPNEI